VPSWAQTARRRCGHRGESARPLAAPFSPKARSCETGSLTRKRRSTAGSSRSRRAAETSLRTFMNEYMALERDGERIGTYPDIINDLDAGGRAGERRTALRRHDGAHPARAETPHCAVRQRVRSVRVSGVGARAPASTSRASRSTESGHERTACACLWRPFPCVAAVGGRKAFCGLLENVLTVAETRQRLVVYAALGKRPGGATRPAYEASRCTRSRHCPTMRR